MYYFDACHVDAGGSGSGLQPGFPLADDGISAERAVRQRGRLPLTTHARYHSVIRFFDAGEMQCRHNVLLSVSALLITGVHFAASQSANTLTVPTLTASVTSVESVITSTAQAGDRVGTSTVQEDQVILSTTTDESTVSISTETVVVTTGNPNTIFITTGQDREIGTAASSVAAASSAATTGDVPVLSSTADAQSEKDDSTSGRGGLAAGAKAGIAVGSILGAFLLASMAYFCLKARSEARPRSSTLGLDSQSHARDSHSVRTTTLEKRPEDTPEPSPEQMTHPAYAANHRLSDHMNLTGIVFEEKDDSPMYIGVPTHLNGGKRWSKPELDQSKIGVPIDEP